MKNRTGLYFTLTAGMLACVPAAFAQTVPNMILRWKAAAGSILLRIERSKSTRSACSIWN